MSVVTDLGVMRAPGGSGEGVNSRTEGPSVTEDPIELTIPRRS